MSSFIDKILPTLTNVAPTMATMLGGPLAGMAVSALEGALGLDPGSAQTPQGQDALTKAVLGMSPEIAASMRKADQEFAVKLRELDIDADKIAQSDRDGARNMQVATKDITPRVIAAAVVGGLFGLLSVMSFHDLPPANHDALMLLLGSLNAAFGAVIGFYFGSSSGSQNKDATIQLQAAKK